MQRHIQPGQAAPELSPGDKLLLGVRDIVSPFALAGWVGSAGYEQVSDTSPNYGVDRGAFGQRLAAAAVRGTTEGFLSNGVMAAVTREDPRYYRLGPAHNPVVRVVYAVTRPLITRTDDGHAAPNFALLAGNLAGSALTNAYYPPQNRGAKQTLATFGGSLKGSALGNVIAEFFGDVLFDRVR